MSKADIDESEIIAHYEKNKPKWNNQQYDKVKSVICNELQSARIKEVKQNMTEKLNFKHKLKYNAKLIKSLAKELSEEKKSK